MAWTPSQAETTVTCLCLAVVAGWWTKVETVYTLHLREHVSKVS